MDGKLKGVMAVAILSYHWRIPRSREHPWRRQNCTTNRFGQSHEQRRSISAEAHLYCLVASRGS